MKEMGTQMAQMAQIFSKSRRKKGNKGNLWGVRSKGSQIAKRAQKKLNRRI